MKTKYILELTEKEAQTLVMIPCSSTTGWPKEVINTLGDIRMALEDADAGIYGRQYNYWAKLRQPSFDTVRDHRVKK